MRRNRIMIEVRRHQKRGLVRCWAYYTNAPGCKAKGWKFCDASTAEEAIDRALSILRNRLVERTRRRAAKASNPEVCGPAPMIPTGEQADAPGSVSTAVVGQTLPEEK